MGYKVKVFTGYRRQIDTFSDEQSRMRPKDLRDATVEELQELYDEGQIPDETELGDATGEVLAGRGLANTSVWRRTAKYSPWAGMRLDDEINRLGYGPLTLEKYGFDTYVEQDKEGGALVLDYDIPENPYALRRLVERVREIEGGLLLGKAYLRVGGREVFLHYYAMEPVEREIPIRS
jgi:hypothetical protein